MTDTSPFDFALLAAAGVGLFALAASRIGEVVRVPLPAFILAVSAGVAAAADVHRPTESTVNDLVTIALIGVLFAGGMDVGRGRLRSVGGSALVIGVAGTFATAVGTAVLLHVAFGFGWYPSLVAGTALSPTDPAVVFSVLGRRRVAGTSGTLLEVESGANDPVGIAMMAALLSAGGLSGSAALSAVGTFALQMAVGLAIGALGGRVLVWLAQRPLPAEGLYPLRTLTGALLLFAAAALAHGSGFLAVFVAGIMIGDEPAPYRREVHRFHAALGSLGEVVAFVVLGSTVSLSTIGAVSTWAPALLVAAVMTLVIRPAVVLALTARGHLAMRERAFVGFAGLKGAVPLLLGSMLVARVPGGERLYGIVAVVVLLSVVVQGGLVGPVTSLLRLPTELVEPQPFATGVRLRSEPQNVHEMTVAAGSPADGSLLWDVPGLPDEAWIALVVRDGQLLGLRPGMELRAGDRVTVLVDDEKISTLRATFDPPQG